MKQEQNQSTEPLFVLKPQLAVAIIPAFILWTFVGTFIGFYVASAFYAATRSFVPGILTALAVIVLGIFFRIMNLSATKYVFYKERAEFYEGFLNIIHQTVRYEKITDCVLIKTVWDRMFGTGTIRLVTAGHDIAARGAFGGGLIMRYMANPDHMYKEMQRLIHK